MNDADFGRLEQKVEQCLDGVNSIKTHIADIYDRTAKSNTEIQVTKAKLESHEKDNEKDIGRVEKALWGVGISAFAALVKIGFDLLFKK